MPGLGRCVAANRIRPLSYAIKRLVLMIPRACKWVAISERLSMGKR